MSAHNMHFHDKIGKKSSDIPKYLCCRKNFLRTQKRVRISHGKRVIGVGLIKGLLYLLFNDFKG